MREGRQWLLTTQTAPTREWRHGDCSTTAHSHHDGDQGRPRRSANRLKRGVLGPFEVAASTMADIAPAMSFYFGFAFLAATSGIASR